jgi:hypothetical protein
MWPEISWPRSQQLTTNEHSPYHNILYFFNIHFDIAFQSKCGIRKDVFEKRIMSLL